MTTPFEPPPLPVPPERHSAGRPGRKLGPIAESVGSAHRAWLEPMRVQYRGSGLTLSELSVRVCLAKSKISELLRGIGLYPRWEIVLGISRELDLPDWPLYRLWKQAALEASKTREWVEGCSSRSALTTTHAAAPLDHRAFRELVADGYQQYAGVFLDTEQSDAAVSDSFDILWLRWNDALASSDTRRFAWEVLRATVMTRTPHIDGRPEFTSVAFDTVAVRSLTSESERLDQIAESLELFKAMSRLPETQLDVTVLRRLCGISQKNTSALMGIALATVRSSERHAEHFLQGILCPPPETEGNPV